MHFLAIKSLIFSLSSLFTFKAIFSGRYILLFLMHDIESFVNIGTAPIHCLQKNPPSKMMYLSLLCPKPWQDHKENPFCFDFLAFQTIVTTSSYVNYLAITDWANLTIFG